MAAVAVCIWGFVRPRVWGTVWGYLDHPWMADNWAAHLTRVPNPGLESDTGSRDWDFIVRQYRRMQGWIHPFLGKGWHEGFGHGGPANGHRRRLDLASTRFVAARHRTWALSGLWAPDKRRLGLALYDPTWLSTLKFWRTEPTGPLLPGLRHRVFKARFFVQHLWALVGRVNDPLASRDVISLAPALRGRHYVGAL